MNRKLRPTKSLYQLKDEQVNFLLEDMEKNSEEYKKIVETKDQQKYCKWQKTATKPLQKKISS